MLANKLIPFLKKNWLILSIILLSATLRLYRIDDYMEFLGDQGRDMVIIRDFLKNGNLFFIGPQTSIGDMYLGPYYYYLISPALLFANFNPIGPSVFIALISTLTSALIYIISKKWFSHQVGIIAALLYSISPVVIKYSSFSWNPNIMPFVSLLFIFFLSKAFFDKQYKFLLFVSLAFVLAVNSHYLALILLPILALYWGIELYKLIKTKSKKLKSFILYTLGAKFLFILSLIPQILFDIKHNGQNIKAIINFFMYRETTVNIKAYKAIPELIPLFNQINTRLLAGKNESIGIIVTILLIIGTFLIFLKLKRNSKEFKYLLLVVIWYLAGLIGLGLYKQHIYDHYFGFIFPPVFILASFIIIKLFKTNLLGKIISGGFLLIIVYASIIEIPFRYQPPKQLDTTKTIVDSIIKESQNEPFNLALLAKQNYDPPYRYFFYESKAPLYIINDKLTEQLYVICEPWQMECQPINNPFWDIAAFGWSKIDKEWEINNIKIFKLVHRQ